MQFSLIRPGDEAQVKHLLATCQLPHEDITSSHLAHFLAAWDRSQLVGVVGLQLFGDAALLRSLAVASPYRGRGIGALLTEKAEEQARSQGVGVLYLLTTTAEDFFARYGYAVVERAAVPFAVQQTAEFQSLCPASAVCMVKHLGKPI